MRVTYFGQACTLIEVSGKKILTDPWLTEGAYLGSWFHTHLLADAGVSPQSFPKDIDYLFLSHEHEDHLDPETLHHFPPDVPVLICKFATPKFRNYLVTLGLCNIFEVPPGEPQILGDDLRITIFGTAEYTNDSAILIEGEGCKLFNETDCKLSFADYERLGELGIDIGFYMFSGANWYPMLYDYPPQTQKELVSRRRRSLLRSMVQRIKTTRPRVAVPSAGPCMVLDPDLLWLNSEERGIFIDPELAVSAIRQASVATQPLYMAVTDVWDSRTGFEQRAPASFRAPRHQYIRAAAERMEADIRERKATEPPAQSDLADRLVNHFNTLVGAQTEFIRRRIDSRLAMDVRGPHGGQWTVDFNANGGPYVRDGIAPDWTYKMEVEDRLLYPFLTGQMPFFEDLLLCLRVRCARRPDQYNEPLYHFLYEPDPEKLHNWYATH